MAVKYIWRDMGWSHIKSQTLSLNSTEVVAGLVGDAVSVQHGDSGLTVAEMGTIHEFGSDDGRVPERSFMRDVLRGRRVEYKQKVKEAMLQVFAGKTAVEALEVVGEWAAAKIRYNISERNTPPPLGETQLRMKGHDHALVDTWQLFKSIGFEILSAGAQRLGIGGRTPSFGEEY